MSIETPKCCEGCEQLTETGSCGSYMHCAAWREWFRKEWESIRNAAQRRPRSCTGCKHFVYCAFEKQAFYKMTGNKCNEFEKEPKKE